jgi:uncharacterized membrane protein YraQ (UPF0718 family)
VQKLRETLQIIVITLLLLLTIFGAQAISSSDFLQGTRFSVFTTIFLGIFIEAAPFLLLGTIASGLVEVFISKDTIQSKIPNKPISGVLVGGLLGFVFPVCECGVVPLTRRLFKKGVPTYAGITFLLASPVINPIVIASTASAFGWGPILWLRIGMSLLIAISVGLIFSLQKDDTQIQLATKMAKPASLVLNQNLPKAQDLANQSNKFIGEKIWEALRISADEFFDMGRYLIVGSALAALMQTFIPQARLLEVGTGEFTSILVMIALAVILSICSTVDAFIALSFVGVFTTGSILAFLVFGPMVDIKSTLMYLQVFNRKTVIYLITIPLLMSIMFGLILNYYTGL